MDILINPQGQVRCVYAETVDLRQLGSIAICRASHVEPTVDGNWTADLSPVNGPVLESFTQRSAALQAETDWLAEHWLTPSPPP